jgi:hypothetical protein
MKIMNQEHELWNDFLNRLQGPEGCNFIEKGGDTAWECKGGMNKDFATAILKTIPNIDIEGSLSFFEENGGHCDCEILFNVSCARIILNGHFR